MNKDVLVVEISGKRPGSSKDRPTEKIKIDYDKCIISNNSDDYITDWKIINVPLEYENWYKENIKSSDNAWYAPMNRSYAIKYAKEHGYKYLIQLDDNITLLQIAYCLSEKKEDYTIKKEYRSISSSGDGSDMMNDFIKMIVEILKKSNVGMVGCGMSGAGIPGNIYLSERYCYSLFGLDLNIVPDIFQGDFEDDIEYRLKLNQMNIPVLQICPFMYGKTAQQINKDLTGCRAEYLRAGVNRGKHMRQLYGDVYSAGESYHSNRAGKHDDNGMKYFKHKVKPIKLGVIFNNKESIDELFLDILKKYSKEKENKVVLKRNNEKIEFKNIK